MLDEWNWLKKTVTLPLKVQLVLVQNPQQQDDGAVRQRQLQPLLFSAIRSRRAMTESMLAPCNLCMAVILHPVSSQYFFLNLPTPATLCPSLPPYIPHPFPFFPSPLPHYSFTASLVSSQSSSNINQNHCRVASICTAALQCHFKVIIACTWVIIKTLSDTELTHPQGQTWASLVHAVRIKGCDSSQAARRVLWQRQAIKLHPELHECACSADSLAAARSAWRRRRSVVVLHGKTCQPQLKVSQEVFLLSNLNFSSCRKQWKQYFYFTSKQRSYELQSAMWIPSVYIHPRRVTSGWRTSPIFSPVSFYVAEKQVIKVTQKI